MMDPGRIQASFNLGYPGFRLGVDLNLPGLGVTVLFGHSGSGKTTLLQCIAGLERVPQGHLWMKGEVWQDDRRFVPTHRRPLGYVFQEASLFPHRSARANLEYGWRRAARPLDQAALDDLIELLGISALLDRRPHQLSGGERQRVAIVRALAVCPAVLLMDEPFSALDLRRKREILPYLERLHDALEIPVLYVTHSPDEVARLADHLVVLGAGRAVAQGPLKEVLGRVDAPIRLGTEAGVVLEGRVAERDARWHLARVEFRGGSLWVRDEGQALGRALRLRVLAKDVSMTLERPSGTSILNQLAVTVREIGDDLHPAQALASLEVDGQTLTARLTHRSVAALALHPGKRVWAQVKTVAVIE